MLSGISKILTKTTGIFKGIVLKDKFLEKELYEIGVIFNNEKFICKLTQEDLDSSCFVTEDIILTEEWSEKRNSLDDFEF